MFQAFPEEHRKRGSDSDEWSATASRSRRAEHFVGVRRGSAGEDEMPGHATWRQVIVGVLTQRGVHVGTDAGRTQAVEGKGHRPIFRSRKSDRPHFGFREKWRRPGGTAACASCQAHAR